MGEVIQMPKPKVPHVMVVRNDETMTIMLSDLVALADGRVSIAEFTNPEAVAKILAAISLSLIDGAD